MIGNPEDVETRKELGLGTPGINVSNHQPVPDETPFEDRDLPELGLGTPGVNVSNQDHLMQAAIGFGALRPDETAFGIGAVQSAIALGEITANAIVGLGQFGIEQFAIKQAVGEQNRQLQIRQLRGLDLDKTAIDPDEYIANFRKSLKEMDMTKHFVDDKGVFNIDDRVHEWRKQTFGGDIVELGEKNPLVYAGAIVGGLGAGAALSAVPLIGPIFSGEAYLGGVAKALGPLGKTLLGKQLLTRLIGGGTVTGATNMLAEIPFAINDAIDDDGNFDVWRFGYNLGLAGLIGGVLGAFTGGGSAILAASGRRLAYNQAVEAEKQAIEEVLKNTTKEQWAESVAYTKRKNAFFQAKPKDDAIKIQEQRVEENTEGKIFPDRDETGATEVNQQLTLFDPVLGKETVPTDDIKIEDALEPLFRKPTYTRDEVEARDLYGIQPKEKRPRDVAKAKKVLKELNLGNLDRNFQLSTKESLRAKEGPISDLDRHLGMQPEMLPDERLVIGDESLTEQGFKRLENIKQQTGAYEEAGTGIYRQPNYTPEKTQNIIDMHQKLYGKTQTVKAQMSDDIAVLHENSKAFEPEKDNRNVRFHELIEENGPEFAADLIAPVIERISNFERGLSSMDVLGYRTYAGLIGEFAPEVVVTLRNADFNKLAKVKAANDISFKFFDNIKKIIKKDTPDFMSINTSLQDRNPQVVRDILEKRIQVYSTMGDNESLTAARNALEGLEDTFNLLEVMHFELNKSGTAVNWLENFWPRSIRNVDALKEKLGRTFKKDYELALSKEAKRLGLKNKKHLGEDEKNRVLTKFISDAQRAGQNPFKAKRTIDKMESLSEYYDDFETAFNKYIYRAINQIEDNKLLGKLPDGYLKELRGNPNRQQIESQDEMIGKVLRDRGFEDKLESGQISEQEFKLIKQYYQDYLYNSRKMINPVANFFKQLSYTGFLANPSASITQFADVSMSLYNNGLARTTGTMFDSAGNLYSKDGSLLGKIGLNDIQKDMSTDPYSTGRFEKFNKKIFEATGFKTIDAFQKENMLRATFRKYEDLVEKGIQDPSNKDFQKFIKEKEMIFGDNTQGFLESIYQGKSDDPNVLKALFHDLAEFQPITFSELPIAVARNKNLGFVYSLKSWNLRYLDLLRKEVWNEMKTSKGRAMGNLIKIMASYGITNAATNYIKDVFMGRNVEVEKMPIEVLLQTLTFTNRYNYDKLRRGDKELGTRVGDFAKSIVLPPSMQIIFDVLDDTGEVLGSTIEGDTKWDRMPVIGIDSKSMRYISGVGKDLYFRLGRGKRLQDKYGENVDFSNFSFGKISGPSKRKRKSSFGKISGPSKRKRKLKLKL